MIILGRVKRMVNFLVSPCDGDADLLVFELINPVLKEEHKRITNHDDKYEGSSNDESSSWVRVA